MIDLTAMKDGTYGNFAVMGAVSYFPTCNRVSSSALVVPMAGFTRRAAVLPYAWGRYARPEPVGPTRPPQGHRIRWTFARPDRSRALPS
jgi:hypothetical protein